MTVYSSLFFHTTFDKKSSTRISIIILIGRNKRGETEGRYIRRSLIPCKVVIAGIRNACQHSRPSRRLSARASKGAGCCYEVEIVADISRRAKHSLNICVPGYHYFQIIYGIYYSMRSPDKKNPVKFVSSIHR